MKTTIMWVEKLTLSSNGNPRWRAHTTDGTYTTSSDAACSYGFDQFVGKHVELTLTRHGRITAVRALDDTLDS